jgi:hypothetical protein
MARGRKAGKRANKTVKLSIPKRLYYILYGVAGNNEQKLNKLIRTIIEERLATSSVAELTELLETPKKEKENEESEGNE